MPKFGKYTDVEFRSHLSFLEAVLGSQKKAAEKLGVSASTYRAYKNGSKNPAKSFVTKANRIYGQNKKKQNDPKVQSTIQKRQKAAEKRSAATKKRLYNTRIQSLTVMAWLKSQDLPGWVEANVLAKAPDFAVYVGDDSAVQFISGEDLMEKRIGKPAGTKSVILYGLYRNSYVSETADEVTDMYIKRAPLLIDLTKEWDFEKTISYLTERFFSVVEQTGKRKFNPVRLLGYQL